MARTYCRPFERLCLRTVFCISELYGFRQLSPGANLRFESKKTDFESIYGAIPNEWRSAIGQPRVKLTGKRLQKLMYLCQLFWYIDHEESKMISEDFQAWPNGPVIPQIYDHFSVYQDGDMCPLLNLGNHSLSDEEATLINTVVDNTIDIPTEAIIDYTHRSDGPWAQVYRDSKGMYGTITKDSIKRYIRNQDHQNALFKFIQDGQNI